MPLLETLPVGAGCAQWNVWGTVARIVVTDPDRVNVAADLVRAEIAAVDAACSRFRADAEIEAVFRAAGQPVRVSTLLAELVSAALRAAEQTDGDVDPTLGTALAALGYDRDFAALAYDCDAGHGSDRDFAANGYDRDLAVLGHDHDFAALATPPVNGARIVVEPVVDWRLIRIDGAVLTVPAGIRLDLGATAKARTADRCAEIVARECGTGVLVALGGDIATAGAAPDGRNIDGRNIDGRNIDGRNKEGRNIDGRNKEGWDILVQDGPDEPACSVMLPAGAAIATSSTISRRWRQGNRTMHHILDPRTGFPVPPVWRTVSVVARTCVDANTASTAALVRGRRVASWLRALDVSARLVAADGRIVTSGGWPASSAATPAESTAVLPS